MNRLPSRLLVITDRHQARRPLPEVVAACLEGGAAWVLFRDRDLPDDERLTLGRAVAAEVRRHGATLSVGGSLELVAALAADGVHLQSAAAVAAARGRLRAGALIGLSAHSAGDAVAAATAGADYATLSPIFLTASKPGYGPALGLGALRADNRIATVALAGITPANAAACIEAGAAAVAVMGEAMRADDPAAVCRALAASLGEA